MIIYSNRIKNNDNDNNDNININNDNDNNDNNNKYNDDLLNRSRGDICTHRWRRRHQRPQIVEVTVRRGLGRVAFTCRAVLGGAEGIRRRDASGAALLRFRACSNTRE